MSLHVVVEGEGDRGALEALIAKIREMQGLTDLPRVPRSYGVSKRPLNVAYPQATARQRANAKQRIEDCCEQYRRRAGVTALLLTSDSEDVCPRDLAPELATWVRDLRLPFPVAVVLFYREYETMFLAASQTLQGQSLRGRVERPGLPAGAIFPGDPEAKRGAKEWLGQQLGRKYVESIDQEALTRTLDLTDSRLGELSSFRRLCSALRFLEKHAGSTASGKVYPNDHI
jgi:hypothetical protein